MKKARDFTGQRFGMLLGIKRLEDRKYKDGAKRVQWLFKCDCGGEIVLGPDRVTRNVTKNCGCIVYENRNRKFDPKEASYRAKASNYKAMAKLREHEWALTLDEAAILLKSNCFYCNSFPNMKYSSMNVRSKKEKEKEKMSKEHIDSSFILCNGIDRVNSDLGYTKENSVSCCTFCNFAKNDSPIEDFYAWINRLIEYRSSL